MVFVEHLDILMNMYWMALIYGIHEIIRMLVGYLVMWKDIIGNKSARRTSSQRCTILTNISGNPYMG